MTNNTKIICSCPQCGKKSHIPPKTKHHKCLNCKCFSILIIDHPFNPMPFLQKITKKRNM